MLFAYPRRKSSHPPPIRPRSAGLPWLRRNRLQTAAFLLAFVVTAYLVSGPRKTRPYRERVPLGSPPAVLVTVIDPTAWDNVYLETITENRERYAERHGYEAMVVKVHDYDTRGAPKSWAKIMAMRHALAKYPDCKFVWFLDQNAYIMNTTQRLEDLVLDPRRLERLMIRNFPVVPPDSIIKTFSHLRGQDANLIASHDKENLVHTSLILRNGEWAKFFVETWLDPLYRSYNLQKTERHALEHIVQWHPTVFSKLALIPQRTFAAYSQDQAGDSYQQGDFVVIFPDCKQSGLRSCAEVSRKYLTEWRSAPGPR